MLRMIAPALLALSIAPASASEGYELRLIEQDAERTIAVSDGIDRFAVARGGEDLDVLDARAAKTAWAEAGAALSADKEKVDWTEGDALTIRESKSSDKAKDGEEKRIEKRVIVRKGEDGEAEIEIDGDHDAFIVENFEDGDIAFIDKDAADGERRVIRIEKKTDGGDKTEKRRHIRIIGAKAESARRFIDEAKGLDAAERAAMKAAVGL